MAERKDYLEGELIIQDLSLREFRCTDGNGLHNIFNDDGDDFNDDGGDDFNDDGGDDFYSLYSGC